jgi:hypothetical protein
MPVVEEYRYRAFVPGSGNNQIDGMISVNITGFNEQPARRAN